MKGCDLLGAVQYNTCFWTLIQQDGKTAAEAQRLLKV